VPTPVESRREVAIIGASISIHGDLNGQEDLIIQGNVEGKVDLKQNNITIGKSGRVKADMYGRVISIEGEVEGNLYGGEQIIVRQSGAVRGNIIAPRVSLEDGSKFKGSIDMEPKGVEKARSQAALAPEIKTRPDSPVRPTEGDTSTRSAAAAAKPESSTARA
jgi:cytoskeletal protein CcmA (bactofilin family)